MNITELLKKNKNNFSPLFQPDLTADNTLMIDFSTSNPEMKKLDFMDQQMMNDFVFGKIKAAGKTYGYGGYLEDRELYRRSMVFNTGNGDSRSIHLGTDIWTQEEKPIRCPLDGRVHSFNNNTNFGDYGPTIILEHVLGETKFFTLYGHLSKESLNGMFPGKYINKGQIFCYVGNSRVNGEWPPHLHFQLITDMMDKEGDFFGVCHKNEVAKYKKLCPDPSVFFSL
ncbi:MAG: peptidoglycan DD-metalloendopeptidase family protein [Bacteroidota bacterium]